MLQFMVIITLPEEFSPRFVSLIPEQREKVHAMMDEGIILNYTLSANRETLWIIMIAKSVADVKGHIDRFPLARYMKAEIKELMFHHVAEFVMPDPSLN